METKEAVYRVAQEALTNAIKHAHASSLTVNLGAENGCLRLGVRDDGAGFDPGGDFPGHMGLQSMRERANRLGGTLEITSAPGQGTAVEVAIPAHES
ncbi:MAG: ATP-binding protein [Dehalococcoidia bacterium]|nr:ATP-binding protein [Dehalococcoidia bacterium]